MHMQVIPVRSKVIWLNKNCSRETNQDFNQSTYTCAVRGGRGRRGLQRLSLCFLVHYTVNLFRDWALICRPCSSSSPQPILPFCVCLWKVTQATASPAKSLASVSGPDQTRWRRFPIYPCARRSFWTCCKTRTGCRWTACTGRSDCIRKRARPGTAWRPATARPPRLSRCWRAAPRVDSPESPTSRRPVLVHSTLPSADADVHVTRYVRATPSHFLHLRSGLLGELPAPVRRCGVSVCVSVWTLCRNALCLNRSDCNSGCALFPPEARTPINTCGYCDHTEHRITLSCAFPMWSSNKWSYNIFMSWLYTFIQPHLGLIFRLKAHGLQVPPHNDSKVTKLCLSNKRH